MNIDGKVAIVTGGGSGMGAATAKTLGDYGATVVVVDIAGDRAAEVSAEIFGSTSRTIDVSDPAAVDGLFQWVESEFGRVDLVAHVAGVDDVEAKTLVGEQVRRGDDIDLTSSLSLASWRRIMSINLDGTFYVLQASLRSMLPRRSGSIVLWGSETGVRGIAGLSHYGATKGGIHALVRSVGVEAAPHGIRVNGIAPGVIDTPMAARSPGALHGAAAVRIAPLGRTGRAEEVAEVAAFLLSDMASYIVGEIINVDGGRMAC